MDWFGFVMLTTGLAMLQIVLNRGERLDWFHSPEIILEAMYAGFALYFFVAHSWTAKVPFFRPQLFTNRNFVIGQIFAMINGIVAILPLVLLPLLLQNVGGFPAITSGALLVFRGIGLVIGMTIIGQISDRMDGRILLIAGLLVMGIAGLSMSLWTVNISTWDVIWTNVLQGVASGTMYVQITALTFTTLPSKLRTEGFAVYHSLLFVGAGLGVAGIIFIHTRSSQISHAVLTESVTPYRELFDFSFFPEQWDIDTLTGLASLHEELTRQSVMIAYNNTFFAVALMSLLAIPLAFLFKNNRNVTSTSDNEKSNTMKTERLTV